MKTHPDLSPLIAEHPFFAGLNQASIALVTGCARNGVFEAGARLFSEGDAASELYLIRHGRIAVEMRIQHAPVVVKTFGPGELLGWSWLVPPYEWGFDARAVELSRVIALDGACLRRKCDADHDLGYELLRRVGGDLQARLHRAWLQMADVYEQGVR